jgi:hypothetical protein
MKERRTLLKKEDRYSGDNYHFNLSKLNSQLGSALNPKFPARPDLHLLLLQNVLLGLSGTFPEVKRRFNVSLVNPTAAFTGFK